MEPQHRIRALLADAQKETGIPGIAVALRCGSARLTESIGVLAVDNCHPFTSEARFQLGCITKILTCLVAADLMEEGVLEESRHILDYLDDLKDCPVLRDVTVAHLMSHTSGYRGLSLADPGVSYYYNWERFRNFLRTGEALFQPGTAFNYEHTELVLLGEMIRRVTGRMVIAWMAERIFGPLGLSIGTVAGDRRAEDVAVADHTYDRRKSTFVRLKSIPFCSFWHASLSDLTMSLGDLVRLGEAILDAANPLSGGRAAFISRAAAARVIKQAVVLPTTYGVGAPEQIPESFGYGVADYGGPLYGHNGSARGQTCGLRFDPTRRAVIAVGLNAWAPHVRDRLINEILEVSCGYAPFLQLKSRSRCRSRN